MPINGNDCALGWNNSAVFKSTNMFAWL